MVQVWTAEKKNSAKRQIFFKNPVFPPKKFDNFPKTTEQKVKYKYFKILLYFLNNKSAVIWETAKQNVRAENGGFSLLFLEKHWKKD